LTPTTIAAWLGITVTAGGVIAGFVKFLFWAYDEIQKRKKHDGFSVPIETLRLAAKPEGNCWWSMGKKGDEPTMQIVGRMFATNISSVPVRLPQIELRYGFLGRKRESGMVMVSRGLHENMYGMYDIPPGETRDASFDFWVYPPVAKPDEHFTAHSIVFLDQFGNRHKVKRVQFRSMVADHPPKPKEPEEFPYAIPDPVEREVVSVLKAEIGRYEICGRITGGLGSVHIVYKGRAFTGVGNDSWTPNSPVNQLLVPDPQEAVLKSDNLDALVTFYNGLASDEERARFKTALLDRLHPQKGYLAVSYFIAAVLMRVDALPDALEKARRDLLAGESRVFGLSNMLMLINGLLKYRYPDFTNQMLDDIERTIHGLNEHPFLIPAKLAAIRTARLTRTEAPTTTGESGGIVPTQKSDKVSS
jgi:hypothetical protein